MTMRYGYKASAEKFAPPQLIEYLGRVRPAQRSRSAHPTAQALGLTTESVHLAAAGLDLLGNVPELTDQIFEIDVLAQALDVQVTDELIGIEPPGQPSDAEPLRVHAIWDANAPEPGRGVAVCQMTRHTDGRASDHGAHRAGHDGGAQRPVGRSVAGGSRRRGRVTRLCTVA